MLPPAPRHRHRLRLPVAAALALLCACGAPRPERALPANVPEGFAATGDAPLVDRWWTSFDDPELDQLVDEALRSNLELEVVWQRLRAAQALAERAEGPQMPLLELEVDAGLRRPEPPDGDVVGLGLGASYEVDLWGRVSALAAAEDLRAQASRFDYRAAALSLSAEVVRVALDLREALSQGELLDGQIAANESVQELIEVRFAVGQVGRVDVLRQVQLVEATRAQRIDNRARIGLLQHQLALLLGRPPREGPELAGAGLPPLPPLPVTGLPLELVRRRPDLRRAHALVGAADRDLAVAIAERYPRLTIAGSLSTADDGADELFDDWIRSLAANLVLPLVDGEDRRSEVERREALLEQSLFEYGQATLVALREVEDALVLERQQARRIDSLEAQLELAERTLAQLRDEYLNGLGDYIDVLTAQTAQQELRRDLSTAELVLLEHRISLYRALAGGFVTEREEQA